MVGVELEFTGERFIPGAGGHQIAGEHAHRYISARSLAANKRVLDLGCGVGYGSQLLAGYASYVGVDIADDAITAAQNAFGGPGVAFEVGDVTATRIPDDSLDLIVCFEVIEHVLDPESVVREAKRMLAPGGVLVLSTPDKDVYNAVREAPNPFHPSELTRTELDHILAKHFRNHACWGQRFTVASAIFAPAVEAGLGLVYLPAGGYGTPPQPMYWVAVASDSTLPNYESSTMLLSDERDLGAELMRAVTQLGKFEAELQARADALAAADERERRARAQLAEYEAIIRRLENTSGT
jgi:2-polyprenyl-3-methyl-5-hydroxy-6-metoxy-1,4-benzoquinol methylase